MNTSHAISFEDEDQFWQSAKDDVIFSIKETLEDYEECRIGLAGGSTPKHLYEMLVEEQLPWQKIKLILVDERYVPSDNNDSNLRMIREAMLKRIPIPADNLIYFDTSLPQESAAKEMHRKISILANERTPIFDLLILGLGTDEHVASLFEGDQALTSQNFAAAAHAENYPIQERLTLTLPALKNSARTLILLKGESKADVFYAIEKGQPKTTALSQILLTPCKILWCKA